jgi:serpin B
MALAACGGDVEDDEHKDPDKNIDIARSELAHDTNPDVAEADALALVASNTAFGLDLFKRLAAEGPDQNLVASPISATAALAMTYAGARGETATEMAAALHFDLPADKLHPAMNQLSMSLAGRNIATQKTEEGDKSVRLSLVNSLWAQKNYPLVPAFLDALAVNYDAGVRLLDFMGDADSSRETINAWVGAETNDRIKDLLPSGSITSATRLVLVNALYFYGSWATAFDIEQTKTQAFHALGGDVQAPTMHAGAELRYADGDDYQVVDVPYYGDKLAMRIVLPAAGQLDAVRAAITPAWLTGVDSAMKHRPVALSLPRFRFQWGTTSLKPALEGMGMTSAFTDKADFSGMNAQNELSIGDVLQQAFIGVDEAGTEAAAATAVIMLGTGAPEEPATFTADRPFIFFIRDASGSILFAGQVTDPTK